MWVSEGRLLDVHDHGVEFCSQFFSIYTVFSIFFTFQQPVSFTLTTVAHPAHIFSIIFFFFAFYLRRKPPFFMRANYAALSIPLSPFLPRSPSLSHPWGVGEAHPHNENLRIRKNVDCSLSQLWHTKWIYSAFFFKLYDFCFYLIWTVIFF